MVKFWVQKNANYDGQEYTLVDSQTMAKLNSLGLGDREVYSYRIIWNYVSKMSSDEKAMTNLKMLLPEKDQKPLIFRLTPETMKVASDMEGVHPSKDFSKENFFNGTDWYGLLIDSDNAWIVYCYTRKFKLY